MSASRPTDPRKKPGAAAKQMPAKKRSSAKKRSPAKKRPPEPRRPPAAALALRSPLATRALGRRLGKLLQAGDFIALSGDLGAGKTLLVRGACEGADVPEGEHACSPTFALLHVYRGGRVLLQHLDLYRLGGAADLFAIGFDDLLAEPAATLCEWPERAASTLPKDRLEITLRVTGPSSREATLAGAGPRSAQLRKALLLRSR